MKKTALVRFDYCSGFAGEPITYVKRVRFFNSPKEAHRYRKAVWEKIGKPTSWDGLHFDVRGIIPDWPFELFVEGSKDYERFAIRREMIEPSREEIAAYIR